MMIGDDETTDDVSSRWNGNTTERKFQQAMNLVNASNDA
jgi:hypothetical protein